MFQKSLLILLFSIILIYLNCSPENTSDSEDDYKITISSVLPNSVYPCDTVNIVVTPHVGFDNFFYINDTPLPFDYDWSNSSGSHYIFIMPYLPEGTHLIHICNENGKTISNTVEIELKKPSQIDPSGKAIDSIYAILSEITSSIKQIVSISASDTSIDESDLKAYRTVDTVTNNLLDSLQKSINVLNTDQKIVLSYIICKYGILESLKSVSDSIRSYKLRKPLLDDPFFAHRWKTNFDFISFILTNVKPLITTAKIAALVTSFTHGGSVLLVLEWIDRLVDWSDIGIDCLLKADIYGLRSNVKENTSDTLFLDSTYSLLFEGDFKNQDNLATVLALKGIELIFGDYINSKLSEFIDLNNNEYIAELIAYIGIKEISVISNAISAILNAVPSDTKITIPIDLNRYSSDWRFKPNNNEPCFEADKVTYDLASNTLSPESCGSEIVYFTVTKYIDEGIFSKKINLTCANDDIQELSLFIIGSYPPVLIYPPPDTIDLCYGRITYSWHSSLSAEAYNLKVYSRTPTSWTIEKDISITDTILNLGIFYPSVDYFWQVSSINGGSYTSDRSYFSTHSQIIEPSLDWPVDGAENISISPTLRWFPCDNAIDYDIEIIEVTSSYDTINIENVKETFTALSNLKYNTHYYWRVRASSCCTVGFWSEEWDFRTTENPIPPDPPTLSLPSNGATNVSTSPTLSWNSSSGATSYDLQVSTNSSFTSLVVDETNITNTTKFISGLSDLTTYYWHVRAKNQYGTSDWSLCWSFTTKTTGTPPDPPTLSLPSNGATNVSKSPTLNWNSSSGATSYDLQVSTNSSFTSLVVDETNITNTNKSISGLSDLTTYYWHVRAKNQYGTSNWSQYWSFTTETIVDPPDPPTLSSPSNGAVNVNKSPTLNWNASGGADNYDLQVSTTSDFTSLIVDEIDIIETFKNISGLSDSTTYYWHVRAKNQYGTSTWTQYWSFTTINQSNPVWISQNSGSSERLFSVYFIDSNTGWVVGDNGTILKTTDGGTTWNPQTSPTSNHLVSVYFISTTTGWVVGIEGTILKTDDGGATWDVQLSGTSEWLYCVLFTNSTIGWVVGMEGTILKTTDGGTTWNPQTSGTLESLASAFFVSSSIGWSVGGSGTILKTTDGGTTWNPQTSGTSNQLASVHFTTSTIGLAVGLSGTIIKTTDGGATWNPQTSGTIEHLWSIYFIDSATGWTVGFNGTILKTTDGGTTWNPQTSGTSYGLESVYFINSSIGWSVGLNGTILHTTQGVEK